jgi:hypothetical protein
MLRSGYVLLFFIYRETAPGDTPLQQSDVQELSQPN